MAAATDLGALRLLVRDCIEKHCYRSAVFFGDKLCLLSEGSDADVLLLCQAYYFSGQHRRALLHLTKHREGARKGGRRSGKEGAGAGERAGPDLAPAFKYLTAKCLAECSEWERCLQVLEEDEEEGASASSHQRARQEMTEADLHNAQGSPPPFSYRSRDGSALNGDGDGVPHLDLSIASFSKRMGDNGAGDTFMGNGTGGGSKDRLELDSVMCVLRAKCYENMDNRERAKQFYIRALQVRLRFPSTQQPPPSLPLSLSPSLSFSVCHFGGKQVC